MINNKYTYVVYVFILDLLELTKGKTSIQPVLNLFQSRYCSLKALSKYMARLFI